MTDLLAAARELRPLIEREAEATERGGTMSPVVVDALTEAQLFTMLVPAALGGAESDIDAVIEISEELSYADGSVGWAFVQNTTVGGYLAYIDPDVAAPLAPRRAGAGMFAPVGVAHRTDGGYTVSGDYKFGSGSGHAEFIGGAALTMVDGEIGPMRADGAPPVIGFIVPADNVQITGNWDVMGLRGTGSFDFTVPEQFVADGATWTIFEPGAATVRTGGDVYGLGATVLGTVGSVAWAVGVARRALAEITAIAEAGRMRFGSEALIDQREFQRSLGLHSTAVAGAKLHTHQTYNAAVQAVADGASAADVTEALRTTKAVSNRVVEVCHEAVEWAWRTSGSTGMRNPSTLQRCFRDMSVGAGHQVFDQGNYVEYGKAILGRETRKY